MAQIDVDPRMLREFAGKLKRFAAVIENHTTLLGSGLGRLSETWKDQEFEQFAREFKSSQRYLSKFVEETKKTAPLLERDAERIEDYQRTKL